MLSLLSYAPITGYAILRFQRLGHRVLRGYVTPRNALSDFSSFRQLARTSLSHLACTLGVLKEPFGQVEYLYYL